MNDCELAECQSAALQFTADGRPSLSLPLQLFAAAAAAAPAVA